MPSWELKIRKAAFFSASSKGVEDLVQGHTLKRWCQDSESNPGICIQNPTCSTTSSVAESKGSNIYSTPSPVCPYNAQCFTWFRILRSNSVIKILCSHLQGENWNSERVSDLPKVTQLKSRRVRIHVQDYLNPRSMFFPTFFFINPLQETDPGITFQA